MFRTWATSPVPGSFCRPPPHPNWPPSQRTISWPGPPPRAASVPLQTARLSQPGPALPGSQAAGQLRAEAGAGLTERARDLLPVAAGGRGCVCRAAQARPYDHHTACRLHSLASCRRGTGTGNFTHVRGPARTNPCTFSVADLEPFGWSNLLFARIRNFFMIQIQHFLGR